MRRREFIRLGWDARFPIWSSRPAIDETGNRLSPPFISRNDASVPYRFLPRPGWYRLRRGSERSYRIPVGI